MNWQQFLCFISSLDNGISSLRIIYMNPLSEHAAIECKTGGYVEYKLYKLENGLADMILLTDIKDEIEKSIENVEKSSIKSYLITYMLDGETFVHNVPEYSEAEAINLFLRAEGFNFVPHGIHIIENSKNQLSRERLIEAREEIVMSIL